MVFHNVLRDYKNLLWDNCRTPIYVIFFWVGGYVKDRVSVPPLPRDLAGLKARVIAALKKIDAPMLTRLWQELEYRIDVCRVIRWCTHRHISSCQKKTFFGFPVAVNNCYCYKCL
jgi:hypothetical protein